MSDRIGIVVIGRNEGERLKLCLDAVARSGLPAVYVDSGSTDGSVAAARSRGLPVVELDPRLPFTAARARNEGFRFFRDLPYVQFVDGDCILKPDWVEKACQFLERHERVAVVCGRLREERPRATVYQLLCDIEWDVPAGEASACGGIALVRASAFEGVGGFRAERPCGEEPELCARLRAAGWRIWRLPDEMAAHDARMSRFGQWWRRSQRNGYGYAADRALWRGESRRAWMWGLGLPLASLACGVLIGPHGFALLALYPLQVARLALRGARPARENWWHALFLVLGKFPEALGQLQFLARRPR
jgi:GT2 family glycosyltransferase